MKLLLILGLVLLACAQDNTKTDAPLSTSLELKFCIYNHLQDPQHDQATELTVEAARTIRQAASATNLPAYLTERTAGDCAPSEQRRFKWSLPIKIPTTGDALNAIDGVDLSEATDEIRLAEGVKAVFRNLVLRDAAQIKDAVDGARTGTRVHLADRLIADADRVDFSGRKGNVALGDDTRPATIECAHGDAFSTTTRARNACTVRIDSPPKVTRAMAIAAHRIGTDDGFRTTLEVRGDNSELDKIEIHRRAFLALRDGKKMVIDRVTRVDTTDRISGVRLDGNAEVVLKDRIEARVDVTGDNRLDGDDDTEKSVDAVRLLDQARLRIGSILRRARFRLKRLVAAKAARSVNVDVAAKDTGTEPTRVIIDAIDLTTVEVDGDVDIKIRQEDTNAPADRTEVEIKKGDGHATHKNRIDVDVRTKITGILDKIDRLTVNSDRPTDVEGAGKIQLRDKLSELRVRWRKFRADAATRPPLVFPGCPDFKGILDLQIDATDAQLVPPKKIGDKIRLRIANFKAKCAAIAKNGGFERVRLTSSDADATSDRMAHPDDSNTEVVATTECTEDACDVVLTSTRAGSSTNNASVMTAFSFVALLVVALLF